MHYFLKLFFAFTVTTFFFASIIVLVDPYDKLGYDLLHLKIKGVFDNRTNKFRDLENHPGKYQAFILGSSRAMQLQPQIVEKATGYRTFNYSVFTANPEDYLAITRFIISTQKNPKLIWLHLDFYGLNKNMLTVQKLTNSPLKEYLTNNVSTTKESRLHYFITKYYSFDALRDSYIVLEKNIKKETKKHYKEDGENYPVYQKESTFKILDEYWEKEYLHYKISEKRVEMLRSIKKLCQENHIKLLVSLSPVSYPHWQKLQDSPLLMQQVSVVKQTLHTIFGNYNDFFSDNVKNVSESKYWMDSVHPATVLGELITQTMFSPRYDDLKKK